MQTRAKTVREYLASLPADRRRAIEAIRKVVRTNLDSKFEEGIQYGMIGYYLPHSVYPDGYHCDPTQPLPFASLANQKNHIGLYLFCMYMDEGGQERFREEWLATGKKLDMGKSCVRVKKLEDVPLEVVGRTIARMTAKKFVEAYESSLGLSKRSSGSRKASTKKAPSKKAPSKKAAKKKAAKKTAAKKTAAKKTARKTTAKSGSKRAATRKPAAAKARKASRKRG